MQLWLIIFAAVSGGYLLYTSVRRLRQKKQVRRVFEQTIINGNADAEYEDPLLEDFIDRPMNVTSHSYPVQGRSVGPQDTHAEHSEQGASSTETETPVASEGASVFSEKRITTRKRGLELVVLTILPGNQNSFSGQHLAIILKKHLFFYGKQKLFHRHISDLQSPVLFSAASIVEPGYFEEQSMGSQLFPGITLFMRVENQQMPLAAFEKMLTIARQLAGALNAQLCDQRRVPLQAEMITQMRGLIESEKGEYPTQKAAQD